MAVPGTPTPIGPAADAPGDNAGEGQDHQATDDDRKV
jgi:hypothetical protein